MLRRGTAAGSLLWLSAVGHAALVLAALPGATARAAPVVMRVEGGFFFEPHVPRYCVVEQETSVFFRMRTPEGTSGTFEVDVEYTDPEGGRESQRTQLLRRRFGHGELGNTYAAAFRPDHAGSYLFRSSVLYDSESSQARFVFPAAQCMAPPRDSAAHDRAVAWLEETSPWPEEEQAGERNSVQVEPGDCLWLIAGRLAGGKLKQYDQLIGELSAHLCQENNLPRCRLIRPEDEIYYEPEVLSEIVSRLVDPSLLCIPAGSSVLNAYRQRRASLGLGATTIMDARRLCLDNGIVDCEDVASGTCLELPEAERSEGAGDRTP